MSEVVEYAETVATAITTALPTGVEATTDIAAALPPCVLVAPVPRRTYDTLEGGYEAAFQIYAIAAGQGTLADAEFLEDTADTIVEAFPQITTVEPVSYAGPNMPEPRAAYLLTLPTHVTP